MGDRVPGTYNDRISLVSLARHDVSTDYGQSVSDEGRGTPQYYQGVYSGDRTISSTPTDVTPVALRTPMSRGFFNLPRYVPKYTINSRLRGTFGRDSTTITNQTRSHTSKQTNKDRGKQKDGNSVPWYPDKAPKSRRTKCKECRCCTSAGCCRRGCCTCSRTSIRCCGKECCTFMAGKALCVLVITLVVLVVLAGAALAVYFGYLQEFFNPNPMAVKFTITGAEYKSYLSDLNNGQTINLTNALCNAFQTTLSSVDGYSTSGFNCSAVSYTNGSIVSIFNLIVAFKRVTFIDNDDKAITKVKDILTKEFALGPGSGSFSSSVFSKILGNDNSNVTFTLNNVTSGYANAQKTSGGAITLTRARSSIGPTTAGATNAASTTGTTTATSSVSVKYSTTGNNTGVSLRTTSAVTSGTTRLTTTESSTSTPTTSASTSSKATTLVQSPSTRRPSTQSTTVQQSSTESTTIQPSSTQSTTTQPSSTQSTTVQPSSTQSTTVQPSSTQSTTVLQESTRRTTVQQSSTNSVAIQPSLTLKLSSTEKTTTQPSSTQSTTVLESSTESTTVQPSSTQNSTSQQSSTESTTTQV